MIKGRCQLWIYSSFQQDCLHIENRKLDFHNLSICSNFEYQANQNPAHSRKSRITKEMLGKRDISKKNPISNQNNGHDEHLLEHYVHDLL